MPKKSTKNQITKKLIELGIYKKEFDPVIERYVELSNEYQIIYKRYQDLGFQCEVSGAAGSKKSPTVTTLESLRKDILNLEDALGLTPRGLLKINEKAFEKPKKSKASELI